jgi:hypothetical protein
MVLKFEFRVRAIAKHARKTKKLMWINKKAIWQKTQPVIKKIKISISNTTF